MANLFGDLFEITPGDDLFGDLFEFDDPVEVLGAQLDYWWWLYPPLSTSPQLEINVSYTERITLSEDKDMNGYVSNRLERINFNDTIVASITEGGGSTVESLTFRETIVAYIDGTFSYVETLRLDT